MRNLLLPVAALLVAATACNDSSAPSRNRPGLRFISGSDVTDTVSARPAAALVVEVRDSSRALAPQGTVVRFTGVPRPTSAPEMMVESLTATAFSNFATGVTSADGRAAVLVQFGTVAGPARIAVAAPSVGVQDTARFTVLPGQVALLLVIPSDTVIYVGRTFTMRGGVADRYGNVRPDPVVYSVAGPGVSVSTAGVVSASAVGRYTLTATAGALSGTGGVTVVPQAMLTAVRGTPAGLRIVAVGLDGSNYRDLTSVEDGGIGPRPRWIAGTNTIVYSHYDGTLQLLRTVDQAGKVSTLFPNPPATMTHQAEPSPAAAAPVLYFSAYDSRCTSFAYCLHRSAVDGSNIEMLGASFAPNQVTQQPAASPDGSKVAFVTGGSVIKVFDYGSKTVSAWSVPGSFPSWSPDGTRIAYVPSGGGPLRVINADGTNSRAIATGARLYRDSSIGWSPDSKWLIARSFDAALDLVEVETGLVLPLAYTGGYGPASLK